MYLHASLQSQLVHPDRTNKDRNIVLSGPGVPLSVNRPRRSGGLELVDVETGGVVGRHGVDGDCVAGRGSIGDKERR